MAALHLILPRLKARASPSLTGGEGFGELFEI
jgi:hypothetical protein